MKTGCKCNDDAEYDFKTATCKRKENVPPLNPPTLPEDGCRVGNDCGLGRCEYEPPNSTPICVCDMGAFNEGGNRYGVSVLPTYMFAQLWSA